MTTRMLLLTAAGLLLAVSVAQSATTAVSARDGIDAGNKAWIDGVKAGDVAPIIATYAEDAVDCGPAGDCITGRAQIEQHMKAQLADLGRAQSAAVSSWGSTQHGDYVYEWGQAKASYSNGKNLVEKYLTVWQKQADGSWKIFRNLVIPGK